MCSRREAQPFPGCPHTRQVRVSQMEGQKANPGNFLLIHAMDPNVAGVIGSAIAAGVLISLSG